MSWNVIGFDVQRFSVPELGFVPIGEFEVCLACHHS